MQIPGERLATHLTGELRPLYVVYGDDPLLVIEASDAIRAAARRQGFDERTVLTALAGFNWTQLHHAAGARSLFGGRTLIELRIPNGKPGREGGAALQDYAKHPSPDALLLVTLPELDWKDEKAAWLNALGNAGAVVKLNAPKLADLPAWIAARLRQQGQSADAEGLAFIAERVEGNLLAAHQEIQKLALLHPPGALTREAIREAVLDVARYDLDALRDAMLAGDVARFTRTLDGLRQEGEAPPLVLWALTEEIRALAQIHSGLANGQTLDGLLRDARVWGARQGLIKQALRRVGATGAAACLTHAARIDRLIKGIGNGNLWDEFLRLGLLVAAPATARR
ncbi:DNA polymerase III subunit delta [Rhodocyclus tenuis]|uniref:DNA polymerase III subunit delta n=1 Tax=Rhodocyclus gracilis TaxID=2929842 RepID=A0ABX0WEW8_9RHOO|nr:DNA polymerase III subunit delta [Rhodocyclus gracilis]NJA88273.1 DNA polymerase III subunit delta [Rhodocyclus gracilis]